MIAILFTGVLFFFISAATGFAVVHRLTGKPAYSIFLNLLIGTAVQVVYFNIWSLFSQTDYKALLAPLSFSLIILAKTDFLNHIKSTFNNVKRVLCSARNIWVTTAMIIMLVAFACVTPYNLDSLAYHYLSILWSEEFRVIPGLANLSAKYGTHSSFFVLSAAYSFTDLFGQAVYPVNFVIVPLFFLKALYKSFQLPDARRYFIWLALLIFCRYVLINIASPSPDALSMILIFYVLYIFYNGNWRNNPQAIIVLIFLAVILKLNTLPLCLMVVYLIYKRGKKLFVHVVAAGSLIIFPWLIRSVLLSGYLLFPAQYFDFFNVDWKVPAEIAEAERLHILITPRLLNPGADSIEQVTILEWVPKWYLYQWKNNLVNFLLVSVTFASPLLWLTSRVRKKHLYFIFLYGISYSGFWFWLLTSPDIRFGVVFMMFCIFIPLSFPAMKIPAQKAIQRVATVVTILVCLHYSRLAFFQIPEDLLSENFIVPPRDALYKYNSSLPYTFVKLSDKVKLYVQDSAYHAIHLPLPVFSAPLRPGVDTGVNVELRGEDVQDGFRYKKRTN